MKLETGGLLATKGSAVMGLYIILSGHLTIHVDRGAGPVKVMEWHAGDVSGVLPYSRLVGSPGDVKAEAPSEIFVIPRNEIPALIRECYELTAIFVHVMLDRTRIFTSSDLHEEKMSSLGKLAAGLAHELNNPASAVARSAKGLRNGLVGARSRVPRAGRRGIVRGPAGRRGPRAQGSACSPPARRSGARPSSRRTARTRSPSWLGRHGADVTAAEALAESAVTLESLDELARALDGAALRATLPWLIAGCATHRLASEIEASASKIHNLVAAVKGFTYMDQATMPKPVDVRQGLADTLAVLEREGARQVRERRLDVPADLPRVPGFGGELNQVWANLVDNALDAAKGRVAVSAARQGPSVVVRVVDDGPGLPRRSASASSIRSSRRSRSARAPASASTSRGASSASTRERSKSTRAPGAPSSA